MLLDELLGDAVNAKILMGLRTNIKIIGCGGGGSNTINRLYASNIKDAELYAANTDAQHLLMTRAHTKILLGRRSTRGLGAGALPQVGEEAAQEAEEEMRKALQDANIVFVTAGMGGGTGTGSAPYVARLAKDMGALTIAIVTSPFKAEGTIRAENAEWGLERMQERSPTPSSSSRTTSCWSWCPRLLAQPGLQGGGRGPDAGPSRASPS